MLLYSFTKSLTSDDNFFTLAIWLTTSFWSSSLTTPPLSLISVYLFCNLLTSIESSFILFIDSGDNPSIVIALFNTSWDVLTVEFTVFNRALFRESFICCSKLFCCFIESWCNSSFWRATSKRRLSSSVCSLLRLTRSCSFLIASSNWRASSCVTALPVDWACALNFPSFSYCFPSFSKLLSSETASALSALATTLSEAVFRAASNWFWSSSFTSINFCVASILLYKASISLLFCCAVAFPIDILSSFASASPSFVYNSSSSSTICFL